MDLKPLQTFVFRAFQGLHKHLASVSHDVHHLCPVPPSLPFAPNAMQEEACTGHLVTLGTEGCAGSVVAGSVEDAGSVVANVEDECKGTLCCVCHSVSSVLLSQVMTDLWDGDRHLREVLVQTHDMALDVITKAGSWAALGSHSPE